MTLLSKKIKLEPIYVSSFKPREFAGLARQPPNAQGIHLKTAN